MRKILSRGFDNEHNVWRYGSLIEYDNGQSAIVSYADRCGGGMFTNEVIPETVGQYTGLDDKNGKKIFEGDILRDGEYIVTVDSLVDGGFSVDYRTMEGKWVNHGYLLDYLEEYESEVINNIHDNPELLEVSE